MNKQNFQFTKIHKYLLVLLLALTSIYGLVAMPKDGSDVSVSDADGTLDIWGNCTENENACKTGLTCVNFKEGESRCSDLKRWYPCDMNDKVCADSGSTCIAAPDASGNDNYFCGAKQLHDVCSTDSDCNAEFECKSLEGVFLPRCIPKDINARVNWVHCDANNQCAPNSECINNSTLQYIQGTDYGLCSTKVNGAACDKTDQTCSDGSTCIDYQKTETITEYYCSNKEEDNICNDASDCSEGMECDFTEESTNVRRCQVVVETQVKCLNGVLYSGETVEGVEGQTVCGADQFYTCENSAWKPIGNSFESAMCKDGSYALPTGENPKCLNGVLYNGEAVDGEEGDTVCGADQFYTCSEGEWDAIGNEFEEKQCKDGELTDIETAVDCGPLDVNETEKVDLGDFDNLVRKWGDSCVVTQ